MRRGGNDQCAVNALAAPKSLGYLNTGHKSELIFQRQLERARAVCQALDLSEIRSCKRTRRVAQDFVIQYVERFAAECNPMSLGNDERLVDRGVVAETGRSGQRVKAKVAEALLRPGCGVVECRRIQPRQAGAVTEVW